MLSPEKHIIKRQIIDISFEDDEASWQLQNRVSELYNTSTVSILEQICDALASNGDYVFIDRLEIDVGKVSIVNLESDFNERVSKLFYESLSGRVSQIGKFNQAGLALSFTSGQEDAKSIDLGEKAVSSEIYNLELVRYFLKKGTFPWWAEMKPSGELETTFYNFLKEGAPGLKALLASDLMLDEVRMRLIFHFSDRLLFEIVVMLAPEEGRGGGALVKELLVLIDKTTVLDLSRSQKRIFVWNCLLEKLLSHQEKASIRHALVKSLLQSISERKGDTLPATVSQLTAELKSMKEDGFKVSPYVLTLLCDFFEERPERESSGKWGRGKGEAFQDLSELKRKSSSAEIISDQVVDVFDRLKGERKLLPATKKNHDGTGRYENNAEKSDVASDILSYGNELKGRVNEKVEDLLPQWPAKTRGELSPQKALGDESEGEKVWPTENESVTHDLYVENAGIILLWPYLGRFFSTLGLMETSRFIDENAAMRAIHLLQYLATGEEETPEYHLSLNKLLCGWKIAEPLERRIRLKKSERLESEKLLKAIIAHWAALKNTSPDGLRGSFLQRDGVLTEKKQSWLLKVDRKTHDMLLERLLWGISIVKLSWMKTIIEIEW